MPKPRTVICQQSFSGGIHWKNVFRFQIFPVDSTQKNSVTQFQSERHPASGIQLLWMSYIIGSRNVNYYSPNFFSNQMCLDKSAKLSAGIRLQDSLVDHFLVLTQRLGAFFLVFCLLLNVFECPEGRYLLNDPKLSGF